jgi:hypothetical protein
VILVIVILIGEEQVGENIPSGYHRVDQFGRVERAYRVALAQTLQEFERRGIKLPSSSSSSNATTTQQLQEGTMTPPSRGASTESQPYLRTDLLPFLHLKIGHACQEQREWKGAEYHFERAMEIVVDNRGMSSLEHHVFLCYLRLNE